MRIGCELPNNEVVAWWGVVGGNLIIVNNTHIVNITVNISLQISIIPQQLIAVYKSKTIHM